VWLLVKRTGAGVSSLTVTDLGNGGFIQPVLPAYGSDYTWITADIPYSYPFFARDTTLSITASLNASGQTISVASVAVWELIDSTSLIVPAIPGSFPALQMPMSRDAIRSSLLSDLNAAWIYVMANRGRQLVCDCRHTGVHQMSSSGWGGSFDALVNDYAQGNYAQLFSTVVGRRKVNWSVGAGGSVGDRSRLRAMLALGLTDPGATTTTQKLLSDNFAYSPPPSTPQTAPRWVDVAGTTGHQDYRWNEETVYLANVGKPPVYPWVKAVVYDLGAVYFEQGPIAS
jgi:hypothetical protein